MIELDNDVPALGARTWLIKPNRASGSKGIFFIRNPAELRMRLDASRSFSLDGKIHLEEFLSGTQHTCEGVMQNGSIALSLVTDRATAAPPYTTTIGHSVPSQLSPGVQRTLVDAIEKTMGLLNVSSGPFDCDFVVDHGEVVLIEMTPRLGGNSLSRLFSTALNFDLVAYAVRYACADTTPIPLKPTIRPSSVVILGVDRAGRLNWNEHEALRLSLEPWLEYLSFDLPIGAAVDPFINGRHRVGEALLTGRDRDDVEANIAMLRHCLDLKAI
jgi:biotin carboxylase